MLTGTLLARPPFSIDLFPISSFSMRLIGLWMNIRSHFNIIKHPVREVDRKMKSGRKNVYEYVWLGTYLTVWGISSTAWIRCIHNAVLKLICNANLFLPHKHYTFLYRKEMKRVGKCCRLWGMMAWRRRTLNMYCYIFLFVPEFVPRFVWIMILMYGIFFGSRDKSAVQFPFIILEIT